MTSNGQKRKPKRTTSASDASHPIPVGENITVLRMPRAEAPFIEGRAMIKGVARGPHWYRVQFDGDPAVRLRIVHPDYQRNTERLLEIMLDLWRASNTPAVAEFFPDETN